MVASAIPPMMLSGLGVACAIMIGLWGFAWSAKNAGLVDMGWALCLGMLALWYATSGDAPFARRVLLGVMVGAWSLRLSLHLLLDRIWKKPEEGRYIRLRSYWGARATPWFLVFFLAQGLLAALLSIPFYLAAHNTTPFVAGTDVMALSLFVFAWSMESLADWQLKRFKAGRSSSGRTCREGLWGWSRHPNYFFEWLIWCSFAILALGAPQGGWALSAPIMMLVFILKITGIPPTEAQALRSRGDDYRAYQRETNAFVPWPPRRRNETRDD